MDNNAETTGGENLSISDKIIAGFRSVPANLAESIPHFTSAAAEKGDTGVSGGMLDKMRKFFRSGASAYAYLLFVLIYFPCIATVGAVYREAGWFVALSQVVYMTLLGWCVSVLFYQGVEGHSLFWISVSLGILGLIMLVFFIAGRIIRKKSGIV
jgi:ferrous iron transport protein B